MSKGWENKEPAPLESMHGKLIDLFHEFRLSKGDSTVVKIDGAQLNNIIAAAKRDTYEKYPNHVNNAAVTIVNANPQPNLNNKDSYMAIEKDQLVEQLILAEALLSHSGVLIAHNHDQLHDIAFASEGQNIAVIGAGFGGTCDDLVFDKKPEIFELTMQKMIDNTFIKEPSEKSKYPNPYSKKGGKRKFKK